MWVIDIPGLTFDDADRLIREVRSWPDTVDAAALDPMSMCVSVRDAAGDDFEARLLGVALAARINGETRFAAERLLSDRDEYPLTSSRPATAVPPVLRLGIDYWLVVVESARPEDARRVMQLAWSWGHHPAQVLDPAQWRLTLEDRWMVRQRLRLIASGLRSGRLTSVEERRARADHRALVSWQRRTRRWYVEGKLATRLDTLLPWWSARIDARYRQPGGEDPQVGLDVTGPSYWPQSSWSLAVSGGPHVSAATMGKALSSLPELLRPEVDDPLERFVSCVDARRVAFEVRLCEAALTCARLGWRARGIANHTIARCTEWLALVGDSTTGTGELLVSTPEMPLVGDWGEWSRGLLDADAAARLSEALERFGCRVRLLDPSVWMPQSLDRDSVKHRLRIARLGLKSGLLTPHDADWARRTIVIYRRWARGRHRRALATLLGPRNARAA